METGDAIEAGPIVTTTLDALLAWAPTRGRDGADLRARVNQIRVDVLSLLQSDTLGDPLAQCFDLAVNLGIDLSQIDRVRQIADATAPVLIGAIMIKHALIQLALVSQARIVGAMTFVSRTDVDLVRATINNAFGPVAEAVANEMDAMTYRKIVALHAAISYFLVETARPLPRMLRYRFGQVMTTLTIGQKLYADALRGDEVRAENKIVHPAFAPMQGRALSS